MTIEETRNFLMMIQSHYQNFKVDKHLMEEWHKYLYQYDIKDVKRKFQDHLLGDYYDRPPKVAYLTKYLTKQHEKGREMYVRCKNCMQDYTLEQYEEHIERENSVNFIEKKAMQLFGKEIDRTKYLQMDQKLFDEKYEKLMYAIYEKTEDEEEKERVRKILFNDHENDEIPSLV